MGLKGVTYGKLKYYKVHMRFEHPNWDEKKGIEYMRWGHSKKEAIEMAKIAAENDGHLGRHTGRRFFTATEETPPSQTTTSLEEPIYVD